MRILGQQRIDWKDYFNHRVFSEFKDQKTPVPARPLHHPYEGCSSLHHYWLQVTATSDPHQETHHRWKQWAFVVTVGIFKCIHLVCSYPVSSVVFCASLFSTGTPEAGSTLPNSHPSTAVAMAAKYCSSAGFALCARCNYWKPCPRVIQLCAPLSIKAAFIKQKDRCFGAFYVGQEAVYFYYYYFHSTAFQHITFLFQPVAWLTLRASLFTNDYKKSLKLF